MEPKEAGGLARIFGRGCLPSSLAQNLLNQHLLPGTHSGLHARIAKTPSQQELCAKELPCWRKHAQNMRAALDRTGYATRAVQE